MRSGLIDGVLKTVAHNKDHSNPIKDLIISHFILKISGSYYITPYFENLSSATIQKDTTVDETSYCSISPQNDLGALLKRCKLIVWDEAPMANKLCFEALDHSLRDILRKNRYDTCQQPFGNMMMVFGSDFGQVHPVIPKGSRQDIVSASLKQPYLWDHCNVLKLTANMRLTMGARLEDVTKIKEFA
ncbi:ATP-dependent DNA helicase PIF1-like protein [Tanacetum coccineum]